MRKILIIIMVLIANTGFSQTLNDIVKIKFSKTVPRSGFTEEIIAVTDTVFINNYTKRNPNLGEYSSKSISKRTWRKVLKTLKKVDLSKVNEMESPTQKRQTDGALHAEIVIWLKDGTELIHHFDDENPHESLQKLLWVLLDLK